MVVTDRLVDHRARAGQYRVIVSGSCGVPSCDVLVGDFTQKDAAIQAAKDELVPLLGVYVYDDHGQCLFYDCQPNEF
jgi:hypothetical protein